MSVQGLLEDVPQVSPTVACLNRPLLVSSTSSDTAVEIIPARSVLPIKVELPMQLGSEAGFLQLSLGPVVAADPALVLGELIVAAPKSENDSNSPVELVLVLQVDATGGVCAEMQVAASKEVIATLQVASA